MGRVNRDIPQGTACGKVLDAISKARQALRDAANPPEGTISITIPGLGDPITGERSLRLLPTGTSIHIESSASFVGAVYVKNSVPLVPQRWTHHSGRQVTGEDMFALILDATMYGGTITLLSYGLDPL